LSAAALKEYPLSPLAARPQAMSGGKGMGELMKSPKFKQAPSVPPRLTYPSPCGIRADHPRPAHGLSVSASTPTPAAACLGRSLAFVFVRRSPRTS
jgi:hypothetical protein